MFKFKKDVSKKQKEILIVTTLNTSIEDVLEIKKEIEKLQNDRNKMVAEMKKRDNAFLDFFKVEISEIKTVEKDQFGKDFVRSSYKLLKK